MSKIFHWPRAAARSPITAKAIFVAGTLAAATVALSGMAAAQEISTYPVSSPIVAPPTVAPAIFFQFGTLTGSGNTLNATRVPLRTSTGAIKYFDIATQYNVNSSGVPVVAPGFPKIVPSSTFIVSGFKAGKYVSIDFNNFKYIATLAGPGVGPNSTTAWSFQRTAESHHCIKPQNASWYAGPIAANPLASRLKAAGITYTGYAYGVSGGAGCDSDFFAGSLLGATQTNNSLTIVSFTKNGEDQPVPVDQITFTLSP